VPQPHQMTRPAANRKVSRCQPTATSLDEIYGQGGLSRTRKGAGERREWRGNNDRGTMEGLGVRHRPRSAPTLEGRQP
jgi:hypothetical protein